MCKCAAHRRWKSGGWWNDVDLLVVDEAHTIRQDTVEFMQDRNIMSIGLTATPFTKGMGKYYQGIVNARTTNQLLEDMWLAPLKIFRAKQIDMSGAKVSCGEWSSKTVESRALPVVGDIVSDWERNTQLHFGRPVKTIGFCATVAHANEVCREFRDAGYEFEVASYRDKDSAEREDKIRRLETGQITGLLSVEALAKGLDIPDIECIIHARPYRKSTSSVIQSIGRGMRIAPGKEYCLLNDHAGDGGNFHRHSHIILPFWAEGWSTLDDGKQKKSKKAEKEKEDHQDLQAV